MQARIGGSVINTKVKYAGESCVITGYATVGNRVYMLWLVLAGNEIIVRGRRELSKVLRGVKWA